MDDSLYPSATTGERLRPGWTMLASGALTSGAFELFQETRTVVGGPPPHVHRDRDEAFFVMDGRYRFTREHDDMELGPGEFIFVPRGTRHLYRTLVAPAQTLIMVSPAGLEGFFRQMGVRLEAGATALEAMTGLSAMFDSHPVD